MPAQALKAIEQLNNQCCCFLDRKAVAKELDDPDIYQMIFEERPYLFADVAVFISKATEDKLRSIIVAVEKVISLPDYQEQVLAYAPSIARFIPKANGVFIGYDFHLSGEDPKLIEINTNAGGALLNALLIRSQRNCCELGESPGNDLVVCKELEMVFMAMFIEEWRIERGERPLRSCAIVDENPQTQYMLPEFLLFKKLFEKNNIKTVICDPAELVFHNGILSYKNMPIDLVYNRLTDFSLNSPAAESLRSAYLDKAVVVTPHPRAHALYANKRNLSIFGDENSLRELGVDDESQELLLNGIAHTIRVKSTDADMLWERRKKLFFKPELGYGSKGTYRGDKMTRRVFGEILENNYVAQTLVQPSQRKLKKNDESIDFKLDLRNYVYRGQTQLSCARLYQGQTTNFRTPGGGFARVLVV